MRVEAGDKRLLISLLRRREGSLSVFFSQPRTMHASRVREKHQEWSMDPEQAHCIDHFACQKRICGYDELWIDPTNSPQDRNCKGVLGKFVGQAGPACAIR